MLLGSSFFLLVLALLLGLISFGVFSSTLYGRYDSKLKDILRNPEGKAIIEKYTPNLPTHPALKMIQMMSLRKLFSYPEAAEYAAHLDEIDAELKALG